MGNKNSSNNDKYVYKIKPSNNEHANDKMDVYRTGGLELPYFSKAEQYQPDIHPPESCDPVSDNPSYLHFTLTNPNGNKKLQYLVATNNQLGHFCDVNCQCPKNNDNYKLIMKGGKNGTAESFSSTSADQISTTESYFNANESDIDTSDLYKMQSRIYESESNNYNTTEQVEAAINRVAQANNPIYDTEDRKILKMNKSTKYN